jgi:hypothetical protein
MIIFDLIILIITSKEKTLWRFTSESVLQYTNAAYPLGTDIRPAVYSKIIVIYLTAPNMKRSIIFQIRKYEKVFLQNEM